MSIEFIVPGEPKAQPRPRARAFKNKQGKTVASVYSPKMQLKADIKAFALQDGVQVYEGPVRVDCIFYFSRPKYMQAKRYHEHYLPHIKKPDRDNLDKLVLDALNGVAYKDDSQVYAGTLKKVYLAKDNNNPGVQVKITYMSDDGMREEEL